MQRKIKYCTWLLLTIACCQLLNAQQPGSSTTTGPAVGDTLAPATTPTSTPPPNSERNSFLVRNIYIEGNKKTRPSVILRELTFKTGDSYMLQDLVNKFEMARQQLMNTTLFHEVVVALKSFDGYNVDVLIRVRERWYLFPVPYIKPVDRNLNQWIVEQKADLSRVDYGIKLLYNNATGRNDKLRLWLINGYTKQVQFTYDRPYFDRKMRWGWSFGYSMGKNQEINYNTIDNKQVFLKADGYIRNFLRTNGELTYRKAIRTKHRFGIAYTVEGISDTVAKLNPDYFLNERTKIRYPELYYLMTYYNLDYNPYPTKGYAAEISVSQKGFDKAMNAFQVAAKWSGTWPTSKKTFFNLNLFGTVKVPFEQPYYNRRLLGYNNIFMQGYEYYVVDGVAGGYLKAAFTRKIFNFSFNLPGYKKMPPLRVPVNIYGRIYGNTGYIYDPKPGENALANKMLYSSGIGLDIVTIYDFVLKLDWSFNQMGQNGVFFHRKGVF